MFSIAMHRGKTYHWMPHTSPAKISCDVPTCSIHGIQQRHLILCTMIIYFPPPCWKKLLYWISEWRVWWKELHFYPFMCSKPVPNNVGSVEADIIPDNNIFGKCGLTKLESGLCKVCLGRPGEVGYYRAQCVKYVCSDHSLKWQHTL